MTQIWLTTTQGRQIYTYGIWQVEDVNLTEKSEGVLNDTKWLTISFTIWLGGNFLQLEDVTLPENSIFNQLWSTNVHKKTMQL